MIDWSVDELREMIDSVEPTTQIIFAHPHYHNHRRIVHCLIDHPEVMYMRFDGSDLSKSDMNTQIKSHISEQALEQVKTIMLDECDRANKTHFSSFLREYVSENHNVRIIVISRIVAHELINDEEFSQRCQFVPTDDKLLLYDYAKRDRSRTLIEVHAFGSGQVYIDGQQVDHWDGILPRQLFFYLADRGMVTRHDIFETFWSNLQAREATNVFHVTKRKITDILGLSFTKFGGGFYRVSPDIELSYDVIRFSEYVQSSVVAPKGEAIELLENAITLYRATFLNNENRLKDGQDTWMDKRREELHEMYGEALAMLAEHYFTSGEQDQALGYYLSALRILNHHEDIVAKVMSIYSDRGQVHDALELYDWIESNLQEDYGIEPNTTLQSFANQLKTQ